MQTRENKTASRSQVSSQPVGPTFFRRREDQSGQPESVAAAPTFFVQPKLEVGRPDDIYEQEADRKAEEVVQRLSQPRVQRDCPDCPEREQLQRQEEPEEEELMQPKLLQRQEEEGELAQPKRLRRQAEPEEEEAPIQAKRIQRQEEPEEEEMMQPKLLRRQAEPEEEEAIQPKADASSAGYASPAVETQLAASKGQGRPLPKDTRAEMEGAFRMDLSRVRIHTDAPAVQMSQSLHAQAFTHGSDIYFNRGKYDTGSSEGKRLLAHELTHVGQQGGGMSSIKNQAMPMSGRLYDVVQCRKKKVTTYDFDEGDTITGHYRVLGPDVSGRTVSQEIQDLIGRVRSAWNTLCRNYLGGIDRFANFMNFEPESKTKAEYLKVIFKEAAKAGIKELASKFKIPGVDFLLGMADELIKEHDRAKEAQRQVRVRDFIDDYRTRALARLAKQSKRIDGLQKKYEYDYQRTVFRAYPDPKQAKNLMGEKATSEEMPRRVVAGPGAEFLNNLDNAVEAFSQNVPSSDSFLQSILEEWVQVTEKTVESKGGGAVYMGGRIYLKAKIYNDGSTWKISAPKVGRLASLSPDRTADALNKVMRNKGISVNDLNILKSLHIEIEEEIDWAFNDYYDLYVRYRNPDDLSPSMFDCIVPLQNRRAMRKRAYFCIQAFRRLPPSAINVKKLVAY